MPASQVRPTMAALFGFVCVAMAFSWPLPLSLGDGVLGPVGGDTGVYIWNLWLFRHEIVAHGHFPFFTLEILSLTPAVPLTLHNYTTLANVAAFPLIPLLGVVGTYNVLLLASGVLAALAMFVFARRATGDAGAAFVAGLVFGFAPFMSARAMEHFSLVQAAPLPLFALVFRRLRERPTLRLAAAAGALVAAAFLCDPYYAVYCLLIGAFAIVYSALTVERAAKARRPYRWRAALDVALICLAGLVAGIVVSGGGRFEVLGVRISVTRLYTPVLVLTVLAMVRICVALRPRIAFVMPVMLPPARVLVAGGLTCLVLLSPILSPMVSALGQSEWVSPRVLWRSSAPGLDLLALFVPNPLHPIFGDLFRRGVAAGPGGFVENVASVPWTLIGVLIAAAWLARTRFPRDWVLFTASFALLALGPFVHIAGMNTYVPTPWTILRYVPVVGAARMPGRMLVLVMLGLAVLLAVALRDLRARSRHPGVLTACVAGLLLFEMAPAPRTLHSAKAPAVYHRIRQDPRELKVLALPFGLRDGLSSYGNMSTAKQFFQTVHEKPLLGGYLSRLPKGDVEEYHRRRVTRALLDLSEGRSLSPERRAAVIARARETLPALGVGYVVVNRARASREIEAFAIDAFDLRHVMADGTYVLYQTPLAAAR
jgi:hypothetical protein